jgi:hypothetical protein
MKGSSTHITAIEEQTVSMRITRLSKTLKPRRFKNEK